MRDRRIWTGLLISLIAAVALLAAIINRGSDAGSANEARQLEGFVAQAIIDQQLNLSASGYKSPDGAVVAHVVTTTVQSLESLSILGVWRYEQGQLVKQDASLLLKTLGDNRSDWPPFTYIFSFDSMTPDQATVDVLTLYDAGLTAGSRGGNAAKWKLARRVNEWSVLSVQPYMFLD